MRTTVVISEPLLKRVRRLMKQRGVTFRSLVERGLERVLDEEAPTRGFKLRDATFDSEVGFRAGVVFEDVAKYIYESNEANVSR